MMYPDLENLPEKLNHEQQLIAATIAQIKKDFLSNGLELSLEVNSAMQYKNVVTKLTESVEWLFENDHQRLMQLLYRIDLPEFRLAEILSSTEETAICKMLADLIVRREAQKVIIRNFYSRGTN